MQRTCAMTGLPFKVTEREMALRSKLKVAGEPIHHPVFRFMQLGAFWQHWTLHRRPCGKTGKMIISVYPEDSPYPVWHKDKWLQSADPPSAAFIPDQPVFPQLYDLFTRSPIAHNVGAGNSNCEYTDDWWFSKNCYLCHSGAKCEDCRYGYRILGHHNAQFCVFSYDCESSVDCIDCHTCNRMRFALGCWQCSESSFLYDCRNCHNCFLCSNLRNKSYCFENEQLTEEAYQAKLAAWDLCSRETYERGKSAFLSMLRAKAWHRALQNNLTEDCTGNYLTETNKCENCYFITNGMEHCANILRSGEHVKDCLDAIGPAFHTELVYMSMNAQDQCYDAKFCVDLIQCKWMEYCAHSYQCEHCFGCCGLVGRKFHIFNAPVPESEYEQRCEEIRSTMRRTGEYGQFFPGTFAATPYEESFSSFYWPLSPKEAEKYGFWMREKKSRPRPSEALNPSAIPDHSSHVDPALPTQAFWDSAEEKPFQIQEADISFAQSLGVPLPHCAYAGRLKDNFRLMPFNGMLRQTSCGKCSTSIDTSWGSEYDGRVLCEKCYQGEVY